MNTPIVGSYSLAKDGKKVKKTGLKSLYSQFQARFLAVAN
jgi:hypothetical protein